MVVSSSHSSFDFLLISGCTRQLIQSIVSLTYYGRENEEMHVRFCESCVAILFDGTISLALALSLSACRTTEATLLPSTNTYQRHGGYSHEIKPNWEKTAPPLPALRGHRELHSCIAAVAPVRQTLWLLTQSRPSSRSCWPCLPPFLVRFHQQMRYEVYHLICVVS